MRELFERYGLVAPQAAQPRGVDLEAADRQTANGPMMISQPFGMGSQNNGLRKLTRNWKTLLALAESPLPARAIAVITDRVSGLELAIHPKKGKEKGQYTDQIDRVWSVLNNPNTEDEDWPTMQRQILEDQLTFDLGCWEYVEKPSFIDGNDKLGLFPVPGFTINRNVRWNGDPTIPRWRQQVDGIGTKPVDLLNSQVEVLIMRKRTGRIYGMSPLETCVGLIDAYLGLASYQAQVASNAYPAFLISLGKAAGQGYVDAFRLYWNQEMVGQGRPGAFGGFEDPQSIQTKATGDEGLYLKYQEGLIRSLAFSFKLKPQDFGIERDVNRSQGEVSKAQSIEEAITPYARMIASRLSQRVIPRIAKAFGDPKILDLVAEYPTISPVDEKLQADIDDVYLKDDCITIDEIRIGRGQEKLPSGLGDMTLSEYRVAVGAVGGNPFTDNTPADQPSKDQPGAKPPEKQPK